MMTPGAPLRTALAVLFRQSPGAMVRRIGTKFCAPKKRAAPPAPRNSNPTIVGRDGTSTPVVIK